MIYYWDKKPMSASVSLCLIRILYGYSWKSFLKILCCDESERIVLGNIFRGTYWTPSDRISNSIHIVRTPCSQPPSRFRTFSLYVEVVYWLCDLKCVYPTMNLDFLRRIVKINLTVKFARQFWMILSSNKWRKIFSLYCPRHCDRGLIAVIVNYFQIWNKKEQDIIFVVLLAVTCIWIYPIYEM